VSASKLLWKVPDDPRPGPSEAQQANGPEEAEPSKPKPVRKPRTKKVADSSEPPKEKKPRKPRPKKADAAPAEVGTPKEKPARQPRAKKADDPDQAKIPRGRVTKTTARKTTNSKATELVSKHFETDSGPAALPTGAEEPTAEHSLSNAMPRRLDWTPVKFNDAAGPGDQVNDSTDSPADGCAREMQQPTDLIGSFGYSGTLKKPLADVTNTSSGPKKRKLIELVQTNASAMAPPEKKKAVKKKPRTITELATSAYVIQPEEEDSQASRESAPLFQYFSKEQSGGRSKSRSKSPVKKSRASAAKKGTKEAPILLSPEAAQRKSARQEFVFGTSSQLARENSPTLLRDLQQAMRESNKRADPDPFVMSDPFVEDEWLSVGGSGSGSGSTAGRGTDMYKAKRNLWAEASMGEGEEYLLLDINTPPQLRSRRPASPQKDDEAAITSALPEPATSDGWLEVVDGAIVGTTGQNDTGDLAIRSEPIADVLRAPPPSSPPVPGQRESAPPVQSQPSEPAIQPQTEVQLPPKPDFNSYTTARLAKEIASYRFKPIKSRNQMIALLEQCWEGKQRVAQGNLGTNGLPALQAAYTTKTTSPAKAASVSIATTIASYEEVPTKPKRGRPRKNATSTASSTTFKAGTPSPTKQSVVTIAGPSPSPKASLALRQTPKKPQAPPGSKRPIAEEIYDSSEEPPTPPPPRRSPSKQGRPPPTLEILTSPSSPSSNLSSSQETALLHRYITRAITSSSAVATTTEGNKGSGMGMSWYEKILLYDPIVLEDLTAWLNKGGLGVVGWDGEVDAKVVKGWCQGRGVCCLWRENLRGGARARY
jgi:hypothetical protein